MSFHSMYNCVITKRIPGLFEKSWSCYYFKMTSKYSISDMFQLFAVPLIGQSLVNIGCLNLFSICKLVIKYQQYEHLTATRTIKSIEWLAKSQYTNKGVLSLTVSHLTVALRIFVLTYQIASFINCRISFCLMDRSTIYPSVRISKIISLLSEIHMSDFWIYCYKTMNNNLFRFFYLSITFNPIFIRMNSDIRNEYILMLKHSKMLKNALSARKINYSCIWRRHWKITDMTEHNERTSVWSENKIVITFRDHQRSLTSVNIPLSKHNKSNKIHW